MLKLPVNGLAKGLRLLHEDFGENGLLCLGVGVLVVLTITKWRQGLREMADAGLHKKDESTDDSQNV